MHTHCGEELSGIIIDLSNSCRFSVMLLSTRCLGWPFREAKFRAHLRAKFCNLRLAPRTITLCNPPTAVVDALFFKVLRVNEKVTDGPGLAHRLPRLSAYEYLRPAIIPANAPKGLGGTWSGGKRAGASPVRTMSQSTILIRSGNPQDDCTFRAAGAASASL
jgi:hypothetical protein